MARQYGVTYPTVRLRLDKLIQKIKVSEDTEREPYIALIKKLAIDDKLDFDTAKILISTYKLMQKKEEHKVSELRFVIFLLLVVGIIVFQVFLSKREAAGPD